MSIDIPVRREHECDEDYFWRRIDAIGILELTDMEMLAMDVVMAYHDAVAEAEQERDEAQSDASMYEDRCYEYEERIAELERDNEQLMEMSADADETTQEDEVEFLKALVRDLEDELAAIDAEQVAVA